MNNSNSDHHQQARLSALLADHIMATHHQQLQQQREQQQQSQQQMAQTLQQLSQSILLNNNFNHGNMNSSTHVNDNNMSSLSALASHSAYAPMYPLAASPLATQHAPAAPIVPPPPPQPSFPQNISFPTFSPYNINNNTNINNNNINTSNQSLILDQAYCETERISTNLISSNYINANTASAASVLQPATMLNHNQNNDMMMMNRSLNEREQFFCFVKILFKLLQEQPSDNNDDSTTRLQLQRCKHIVRECTHRNRRGDPDCQPLVACLRRRLRPVIGEDHWRQAETVLRRSLELKAERQEQQQADPAQTIIATAV